MCFAKASPPPPTPTKYNTHCFTTQASMLHLYVHCMSCIIIKSKYATNLHHRILNLLLGMLQAQCSRNFHKDVSLFLHHINDITSNHTQPKYHPLLSKLWISSKYFLCHRSSLKQQEIITKCCFFTFWNYCRKKKCTDVTLEMTLTALVEIFDKQMALLEVWPPKSQNSVCAVCIYCTHWKTTVCKTLKSLM
jgi:hypothetical protein